MLFADLVGFTALAEDLRSRTGQAPRRRAASQRLVADVTAFGGRVDKILGDGILALFGAPVAHEDDAERAVRAALRMQETLRDEARADAHGGVDIRMRVGINTGEVLVGRSAPARDYTAMGDVVNTAVAPADAGAAGRVLVGEPPMPLTAPRDPLRARRRARGPRPRASRSTAWLAVEPLAPPGVASPARHRGAVRRARRRAGLLLDGLRHAVEPRARPFLAAVDGEGGVGKSRLVRRCSSAARVDDGVRVLEGSCVPYGEANPWWPIASALAERLRLEAALTPEEIRAEAVARGRRDHRPTADDAEAAQRRRRLLPHLWTTRHRSTTSIRRRRADDLTAAIASALPAACARPARRCCHQRPALGRRPP